MSEKMRKDFERWQVEADDGPLTDPMWLDWDAETNRYGLNDIQAQWETWQASRASICVELPEEEEHKGVHYDIDYMPTEAVIEAITKTGVRVK